MKFSEAREIILELCSGFYASISYEENHHKSDEIKIQCALIIVFGDEREAKSFYGSNWEKIIDELKFYFGITQNENLPAGEMNI